MAYSPRTGGYSYRRRSGSAGTRSGAVTQFALRTEGLAELRRAMKVIAPEAEKDFQEELKGIARRIAYTASRRAPRKSGRLANNIKTSVRQREMALYVRSTTVPYARLQEWGSSGRPDSQVQPKGVPIKVRRTQFLGRAVYSQRDTVEGQVIRAFERVARRNGFDD